MHSTEQKQDFDFDYIVIGSGFGGSVSALRLTEKGYKVCVLEKGMRFGPKDFAKTNWNLRKYLWAPIIRCFGIQQLSLFKDVFVLSGTGVGGGSLVYANTLLEPGDDFYQSKSWSGLADWKKELRPHYDPAKAMLGVTKNPRLTQADHALREVDREMAAQTGRETNFKNVDVAVYFSEPGKEGVEVADPYFKGEGPRRAGCTFCGGCMVGCRHNSKNTLDKNYLYFAEKKGAVVQPNSEATQIIPFGEEGYRIQYVHTTAFFKKTFELKTKGVVLSGGVLGTLSLLLKCRDVHKTLKNISSKLGEDVRTNGEAFSGITAREKNIDFTDGVAISSGFYPEPDTHIEIVRYPKGSSFMKLLAVPMVDGASLPVRLVKLIWNSIAHIGDTLKLVFNGKWAESSIILLIMQTRDYKMRFKLGRSLFSFFRLGLVTEQSAGSKIKAHIPLGNSVTQSLSQKLNAIPQSNIIEVALRTPATAHILGGCKIAATAQEGVINSSHELFGYKNIYVCDGSVIPANLGVNPSLTITALTERCMSLVPDAK